MERAPTLLWLRRDLRLGDHPGWSAALAAGGPVLPVFIRDPLLEQSYGAAPKWRLGESLADHARALAERGSRLTLRHGDALDQIRQLVAETGARRVVWSRLYDSRSVARDKAIKAALVNDGIDVVSVNGSLLFEPWTVATKTGGFYKVYTPFWRAVRALDVESVAATPRDLAPPPRWPATDRLQDWALGAGLHRGAEIVARHARIGERAAAHRLERFLAENVAQYASDRDRPDRDASSRLSESLTYGEISPRAIWHAGRRTMEGLTGAAALGAETFLKQLAWREFAYHLMFHTPRIETESWRPGWSGFPWRGDNPDAERWRRAITGFEMVDAGLREMYVTGTMHNRVRMLAASILTKHLMTHWRIGEAWFRDCLIDWDPASNAMGWQWSAGSGPDAAPYFRVFNPITQAEKFDPDRAYRDRWLAAGRQDPSDDALSYFAAVPRSWGLEPVAAPLAPVIGHAEGRRRALDAYAKNRPAA